MNPFNPVRRGRQGSQPVSEKAPSLSNNRKEGFLLPEGPVAKRKAKPVE